MESNVVQLNLVPDNEFLDQHFEFVDDSENLMFHNNIESKVLQIESIPVDFIFSETEVSKTFVVQEDGTLTEIENLANEKSVSNEKVLTRKRNPANWKCNVAKDNRQSGKPYKNRRGETRRARSVKTAGCANPDECPFECMKKIDMAGRQEIYNSYWNIPDKEKRHFYAANVKKVSAQRKRTKANTSQKPYIFNYYFNYLGQDIRVCQQFFINTLDVNKGRVYYFFSQSKKRPTVTPGPAKHGKHVKKQLSAAQKQSIRDHINKFPAIESHYCRSSTKKQYLDQGLNVSRMYRMYCTETENPVKESAYRNIFDYEFNLAFFRPKKDRCDKCVESTMVKNPSEENLQQHNLHVTRKNNAHAERNEDRKLSHNSKIAVIPFDLENVFQLPIANSSQLFYLRKFAVYVLTVYVNGTVYNVMWNEFNCGREGTHLASALMKALKQIFLDNPDLEHLTLWSDSCVPQNRNSYMSAALQHFLSSDFSGNVKQIDHKYSEAGHGEVQEVDNVHSVTEKFIRHKFIYSPLSLIKEFHKIESGKLNFKLLEMTDDDFDYQSLALASKYSVIPYTKVSQLRYMKNQSQISYKLNFTDKFIENNILLKHNYDTLPTLNQLHIQSNISSLKIANLRTMFGMMPEDDKQFYETEIAKLLEVRALTGTTTVETKYIPAFDTAESSVKSNTIVRKSHENIGKNVVTDVRARKRLNKNDSAASISNNKKAAMAKTSDDAQTSKGRFVIDSTRPPSKSVVITKSRTKSTDKDNDKKKTKNGRPTAVVSSQLKTNEKMPAKTRASRTSKTSNQTRKKSK